jgi:hypothetical protein
MIELSAEIGVFITAGLYDTDLPFKFVGNTIYGNDKLEQMVDKVPEMSLESGIWKPLHCDAFQRYQGGLSVPLFNLAWAANEEVPHFSLADEVALPFIELEEASHLSMFSPVRKVKIHPSHHNAPQGMVSAYLPADLT